MRAVLRKAVVRLQRVALAAAFGGWKAHAERHRRGGHMDRISDLEARVSCSATAMAWRHVLSWEVPAHN